MKRFAYLFLILLLACAPLFAGRSNNGSTSNYLINSTSGSNLLRQYIGPPWTVGVWVKLNATGETTAQWMIDSITASDGTWGIIANLLGVANTVTLWNAGGGGNSLYADSRITLSDTNWHHIAYRRSGTSPNYAVLDKFLDGVKTNALNTLTASDWFPLPNGTLRMFYSNYNGVTAAFDGAMADFFCVAAALSDSDIAELATTPKRFADLSTHATYAAQVQAYYKILGGDSPVVDYPGGSFTEYDLTVNGTLPTVTDPPFITSPAGAPGSFLPFFGR